MFSRKIEEEIVALFDFMQHIYGLFGFDFHLELSTRPDNYLGTVETWNEAEAVFISPLFHLFPVDFFIYISNSSKHWINTTPANGLSTPEMARFTDPKSI